MSVSDARNLLLRNTASCQVYSSILSSILSTGYDINSNQSEFLVTAIAESNANPEVISLLLARGASVASETKVYHLPNSEHPFAAGRIHSTAIADLLLEHILEHPHFEVIKKHLLIDMWDRVSIFNNASSDSRRAELYARLGRLPKGEENANVIRMYAENLKKLVLTESVPEQLKELQEVTKELTAVKQELEDVTTERDSLKEVLKSVTQELSTAKKSLEKANRKCDKLKANNYALSHELGCAESDLSETCRDLSILKSALTGTTNELDDTKTALDDTKGELFKLRDQYAKAEGIIQKLSSL